MIFHSKFGFIRRTLRLSAKRHARLRTLNIFILAVAAVAVVMAVRFSAPAIVVYLALGISAAMLWEFNFFLSIESRQRLRQHRRLVNYVNGLRRYSVGNIGRLNSLLAVETSTTIEIPPATVPQGSVIGEDRPLITKERNVLLAIVSLLCEHGAIDWKKPAAAARVIKELADESGIRVGESTIEGHLKRIPEALEVRGR